MKRWTLPVVVGVWVAGCGFFDFPAPERAPEGHGGAGSGGTRSSGGTSGMSGMSGMSGSSGTGKGGEAGDSTNGGSGGESPEGGTGGSTSGAAGAGEGGTGGAGEGGTSGSSTGGTAGDGGGGTGPTEPVMQGLKLWLDATSLADGQLVTWPNRVAGGEPDANQAAVALRPVVATFDGRKGVEFDGTRWMTFSEGFENWSAGLTFFLVARFDAPDVCTEIFQVSNGQEVDDISFQSDVAGTDPGVFLFEVFNENIPTGPFVIGGAAPSLATVIVRPPDAASVFINTIPGPSRTHDGFLPATVARANNFLGSGLYIGCDPFEGVIFELLLYNRGLSEANVALVSEYLQAKWGCCDG